MTAWLRKTSIGAIASASFLAAMAAAALCFFSLQDMRKSLAAIDDTTATQAMVRGMADLFNDALVSFAAIAVDDLTDEERHQILTEANLNVQMLEPALQRVRTVVTTLTSGQEAALVKATQSIVHSWQELRDQADTSLAPAEKAYHFLRVLDDLKLARLLLAGIEQVAEREQFQATREGFDTIRRSTWLVAGFILAGAMIAGLGVALVLHHLRHVSQTNAQLADTNKDLHAAKLAAESASRAKSQFLATISHELRTPLNAIVGFSALLRDAVLGPLGDPKYQEFAADINASGLRLTNLINDIIDFSRAEAGTLALTEDHLCLGAVAAAATALVRGPAAAASLVVRTELEAAPQIMGDERCIKQMLRNLLSNAVKFTPAGGEIVVQAGIEDGLPMIRVRDTGIGIAEADLPKVLEPFGQVDGSLSRRHEGTGLGLPLVRKLAELHGASLRLHSAPDQGTTATIVFPRSRLVEPSGSDSLAA